MSATMKQIIDSVQGRDLSDEQIARLEAASANAAPPPTTVAQAVDAVCASHLDHDDIRSIHVVVTAAKQRREQKKVADQRAALLAQGIAVALPEQQERALVSKIQEAREFMSRRPGHDSTFLLVRIDNRHQYREQFEAIYERAAAGTHNFSRVTPSQLITRDQTDAEARVVPQNLPSVHQLWEMSAEKPTVCLPNQLEYLGNTVQNYVANAGGFVPRLALASAAAAHERLVAVDAIIRDVQQRGVSQADLFDYLVRKHPCVAAITADKPL